MKTDPYNRGQSLIGIIIVLVAVGLLGGGFYIYLSKQISEIPEITEKTSEEITTPTSTPSSTSNQIPPPTPTLIAQKCTDGTPYSQCSTNKPKYCDNGRLVDKISLCGCQLGYEINENECTRKLAQDCGIIHEDTRDYSKAINFVIIPADTLDGYANNPDAQYSNNLAAFIVDAKQNVDGFLSMDPINKYKNIFNFYYTTGSVIKCAVPENKDYVVCDFWKEAADKCNIPYDLVIVLQRKEGGGLNLGYYIEIAAHTNTTFIHEIGHVLGFRDWDDLSLPAGPNDCNTLDCCGGILCPFQEYSQQTSIESGGPSCCIYKGTVGDTPFYRSNEESIMGRDYNMQESRFNYQERVYLNELFTEILSKGKDNVRYGIKFILDKYRPHW